MSSSSTVVDIHSEAEAAKKELAACEREISSIKSMLRAMGPGARTTRTTSSAAMGEDAGGAAEEEEDRNSLTVYWRKVSWDEDGTGGDETVRTACESQCACFTRSKNGSHSLRHFL